MVFCQLLFVVVDVHGQSAALYGAFWPVFLLRRGLCQGKALPAPKYRHLMTYYDNRFAQDTGLLFCLANPRMRHEVNHAASAKVRSSGRAFEQFKEAINDEDFEVMLKDAQADPKAWRRRTCSRRCCRSSTFRVGSSFESVSKLLLTGKREFTFVVFHLVVGRR